MSDTDRPPKIKLVKERDRGKMPAKADQREEIKRISDLLVTLSKRVKQLDVLTVK